MSEFVNLRVQKRDSKGKGNARRLRAEGIIPAIFYSCKGDSIPVQVVERELSKVFSQVGRTTVFNVEVEENGAISVFPALIWDIEYYPVKNRMQHVDFFGVDLDKELKITVPLEFVGTAKGTKLGGKLEIYREKIQIWSKPLSLPSKITVDISDLALDQGLRIADLTMPEGVRPHYDVNFSIVTVINPSSIPAEDEGK